MQEIKSVSSGQLFAMLFVYSSRVSAQDVSDEYKSQLREMLTVSGSLEGARQVVPQLLALVKQQQPEISDEACRKVEETFNVKVIDRMVDLYAPIYIKYLTLDESVHLLNAMDSKHRERDYCILTLFLNCGLRISELIGINCGDIHGDALRVFGKGGKTRIVYRK